MARLSVRAVWLLVLTVALAACGSSSDDAAKRATTAGGTVTAGEGPGVVHVHALGINPSDGALFAATHTGLFRIPESGRAERVGDRLQDTMGFTITGPNRFLGSGHPDLRDYRAGRLPPLLGLIESTDGGKTWTPLSLLGQADFHALRTAHGRVYGYDSTGGGFMVSTDGKTWETRSRAAIRDFAVSPSDPETVLAAMVNDVRRSTDGGRTWEPVNAPALVLLSWSAPDELWGATAPGAVLRSADGGATWQQQNTLPGPPEALLATGTALYASIHNGGIYVSEDGGKTWALRYRDPA
jgi:photosystem II stability/assembly factor-like uncharacterized protein